MVLHGSDIKRKMMSGTQVNILFTVAGPLSLEQRAIINYHAQLIINKIGEGAGQIEYFIESEDWDDGDKEN